MRKLENTKKKVVLKGQHSIEIPTHSGAMKINITLLSGSIQLNHGSYTPDGGTWLMSPDGGRKAHYPMTEEGDYEIEPEIRDSFGKQDRLFIVNSSLLKPAEFVVEIQ